MKYASKSREDFPDGEVFGELEIEVPDPAWVRPTDSEGNPDTSAAQPPLITVRNPSTRLPFDAVLISDDLHDACRAAPSVDWSGELPQPAALPLEELKRLKNYQIGLACDSAILVGFMSSALGEPHTYPAKPTDQANLTASVLSSMMPGLAQDWSTPFWCMDAQSVWAFRLHSAVQIQQVGSDGKAAILSAMSKKQVLDMQVDSASSSDAVANVSW